MIKRPFCAACLCIVLIQAARVCLTDTVRETLSVPGLADGEKRSITAAGTVASMEEKQNVTAVVLSDCRISSSSPGSNESRILVYLRPEQQTKQVKIGNRLEITGTASVFEKARNPGNFDQSLYYGCRGLRILLRADHMEFLSLRTDPVRQKIYELKQKWKHCLLSFMGEYYGGITAAVLLADKGSLDEGAGKLYQKSGIAHLLAVSGLHMSFVGTGIYRIFRKTGAGYLLSGAFAGTVLLLYFLMIGPGMSSLRAVIMFLVRLGADMTGRDYDPATSLSLSAAVICIWQPFCFFDAAFQLSFGAAAAIGAGGPLFACMLEAKKNKKQTHRAVTQLKNSLSASMAVSIFLLGPVLYYYFEIPPYSLLLNLLVIPAMPAVMAAGTAGPALSVLSETAAGLVMHVGEAVLFAYDRLCIAVSGLPGSRFVTGRPGSSWLIFYYLGIAASCGIFYLLKKNFRDRKQDRRTGVLLRLPGFFLVLLSVNMAVLCRSGYHVRQDIQITVLDTGQGDAIHIRTGSGDWLVDGGSSDITNTGTYRIEPYLLSNAADRLEYVFVTHGDEDHINGIRELLENQVFGVKIEKLVLPPAEYMDKKLMDLAETAVSNGTGILSLRQDGCIAKLHGHKSLSLICRGPGSGLDPGNEASLVLELKFGNFRMLLTGDLEGEGERQLTESGRLRKCTVLKVAHHGSRNSGSEEFIRAADPEIAVISAGRDNPYGHPHRETLERLSLEGCKIISTQRNGAVRISTDGEKMKVTGFLNGGM